MGLDPIALAREGFQFPRGLTQTFPDDYPFKGSFLSIP